MMQIVFLLMITLCSPPDATDGQVKSNKVNVQTGLDLLVDSDFAVLAGKRVGVITNHTGLTKDGQHIADIIHNAKNVTLAALFGPEHGIRGSQAAGVKVQSDKDPNTGVPVYSLYSENRKPTAEMLADIDVLLFDIQDVGARFYTYIYTMALAMESAALNEKQFIVLDRPNPITGDLVEGPLLREGFESFVGLYKLAVRHGMTVAELASMFKGEKWIKGADKLDLKVIKLKGWTRDMWMDEIDVPWVPPSPNMLTLNTALVYPGMCFFEGLKVSEGRGTDKPFEKVGAPWIDAEQLSIEMNKLDLKGVTFDPVHFTPQASPAVHGLKFKDQPCNGLFIDVRNREIYQSVLTGIQLIRTIKKMYPDKLEWTKSIDRLYGSDLFRKGIDSEQELDYFIKDQNDGMTKFLDTRKKYLLYPEQ